MRTVHAFVHHEGAGFNDRAFARFEYHRTDGQLGRSASLHDFDVGLFREAQRPCASVRDLDGEGFVDAKFYVAVIDLLLVNRDGWSSAAITTTLIGEEKHGSDQQYASDCQ